MFCTCIHVIVHNAIGHEIHVLVYCIVYIMLILRSWNWSIIIWWLSCVNMTMTTWPSAGTTEPSLTHLVCRRMRVCGKRWVVRECTCTCTCMSTIIGSIAFQHQVKWEIWYSCTSLRGVSTITRFILCNHGRAKFLIENIAMSYMYMYTVTELKGNLLRVLQSVAIIWCLSFSPVNSKHVSLFHTLGSLLQRSSV